MSCTRRDWSRRKPVPIYIPSPLASPTVSQPHSLTPEQEHAPVPPLPDNWREVIRRVLTDSEPTLHEPPSSQQDDGCTRTVTPSVTETFERDMSEETLTLHSPKSISPPPDYHQIRRPKPHHIYRPPTPPLTCRSHVSHSDHSVNVLSGAVPAQRLRSSARTYRGTDTRCTSFTLRASNPSLKTYKSYLTYSKSEPSALWSSNGPWTSSALDFGGSLDLPQYMSRYDARRPIGSQRSNARIFLSSLWSRIEDMSILLRRKIKRFWLHASH